MHHLKYKHIKHIQNTIPNDKYLNSVEQENNVKYTEDLNISSKIKKYINKNKIINEYYAKLAYCNKYKINQILLDNLSNIPVEKINGVDKIYYINLNRSINRNNNMVEILSKLSIPYERIEAIDGNNLPDIKNKNNKKLRNSEIGCLLSHIKAINEFYLSDKNICLILEDDISFVTLNFVNTDIKSIIENAPQFDILMISKTYLEPISSMYIKHKDVIWGSMGYIITKKGAEEILKLVTINKEYTQFDFKVDILVSDSFLYKYCNTIVYKYSIIIDNSDETTIGNSIYNSHTSNIYQTTIILSDLNPNFFNH